MLYGLHVVSFYMISFPSNILSSFYMPFHFYIKFQSWSGVYWTPVYVLSSNHGWLSQYNNHMGLLLHFQSEPRSACVNIWEVGHITFDIWLNKVAI